MRTHATPPHTAPYAAVVFACSLVAGCDKPAPLVTVDGSSTVFPITEAVAEQFQRSGARARVTVGISGTGGGFKKLCAGEIDLADASRPIKPSEVEQCQAGGVEYVELPVAYDGLAIVVHLANTWAQHITVEELRLMWQPEAQGKVMRWNQVRPDWPDRELHLYGAGVDSGTYDYFTEAIVGKEHASRGDYTSSEDDNVLVQGIARDELALGFFGLAYYEENRSRVRAVPVDDGKPENGAGPVAPSSDTVRGNTYQPLARPLFVYVSRRALDRPEIEAFVRFYLEHAPHLVAVTGYVPLPERAYALATTRVTERHTGSLFGGRGSQVGVSIESLLDRAQAQPQSPPSTP
jgi:phosphate transport system substrate-binding protein